MDVVSTCPLRVGSILWQPRPGVFVLTVVCKATLTLLPVESPLAGEQDPPNEGDNHWNDDEHRSLHAASDLAPFKPRADVFLVGHAHAPRAQPVSSLIVRMIAGDVDKSIEVHADRTWTQDGQLREAAPFTRMPLRYERAGGGPTTSNPVGMRPDAQPDRYGHVPVPNLQPPGYHLARPGDAVPPIGLGPIAPGWPGRWSKLYGNAAGWDHRTGLSRPLPQGLDPGFFNAAPPDQQTAELRGNERLVLEHLHPEHARLVTSLPGLSPRATVAREGQAPGDLALRCDTLVIDVDRGVCSLVWRGQVPLSHATQPGRVVVHLESGEAAGADDGATETIHASARGNVSALPFTSGAVPGRALDPPRAAPPAFTPHDDAGNTILALDRPSTAALPFAALGLPSQRSGAPPPPVAPPAPLPPPAPPTPLLRSPVEPSAWAPAEARPDRPSIGQSLLAETKATEERAADPRAPVAPVIAPSVGSERRDANIDEGAAKRGWKPAGAPRGPSPPIARAAPAGSALAASNAAAGVGPAPPAAEPAPAPRVAVSAPREVLELVWLDPAFVPRIRRKPGWKEIMAQAKPRPNDDELGGDAPPEKRQELRDRREVLALLARGEPTDPRGVDEAIAGAVGEDGAFVPPLVLVAGQLDLPFDEVEELKATIAAVTPLAGGDARLQASVDTAQKLLQTPWLNGASEIAAGLTGKIKEAFGQGNRALPARYLEQTTERMLLHQRAYQKRMVLGKMCLRGILTMTGAAEGVPVYVPESLGQELPAFLKFGVRMVAEARMRVDQYEAQGVALRAVALGRATPRR